MPGSELLTGTTVVKVTFKNIKTAKTTAKKYRCVVKAALEQKPEEPTTTAGKITAIKQTSATKLAAEFSADMTGIKYTDLKIVRDETGAVVTVKSATVDSKDNTKVTIETYEALTDGKAYNVTYTAADEAKTESSATFTATAGVVADIALNTYTLPANTPTTIKYQLLDANGVLIEEKGIGSKSKSDKVDISIENFNGYQNENEVTLYQTGAKATMKVVYHTWKYNNTDGTEEGKVEKTFEITAVDQSSVIETYEYSVAAAGSVVDFKRDTLKTQLAIDDDKDSSDPHAYFSFRKADGTDITKSLDYTVESGNENVLLANGTVAGSAQLTPVGVGATYLVIKNASGSIVKTLPINVVAKRELSTMTVDKSHVTISKEAYDSASAQKITIAVMDQYSDAYSKFTAEGVELKSGNKDTAPVITGDTTVVNNKVYLDVRANASTDIGTYSYTLDLKDSEKTTNVKKVSFSVTVSRVLATNNAYALVMMKGSDITSKVDTTVGFDAFAPIILKPVIVVKNNGVITGEASVGAGNQIVSIAALTVKKGGSTVDAKKGAVYNVASNDMAANAGYVKVATGYGSNLADPIVKNLDAGTYTVSLTASVLQSDGSYKNQNMSTSFVVEDSQKVFEASVKAEKIDKNYSSLDAVFEDTDYVKFSYAGHELGKVAGTDNYAYASSKNTKVNDKSTRVEKVTMNVELPGTSTSGIDNKVVQMTAPVNRTFTFTSVPTTDSNVKASINTVKSFADSNNNLKAGLTPANLETIVNKASQAKNESLDLTAAEQASIADDKADAIEIGQKAALELLKDVKNMGSYVNMNVFDILTCTTAETSELANYKKLMSNSDAFTSLTTTNSALTAVNNMVSAVSTAKAKAEWDAKYVKNVFNVRAVSHGALASQFSWNGATSGSTIAITSSAAVVATNGAFNTITPSESSDVLVLTADGQPNANGAKFTLTLSAIKATQSVQLGTTTKGEKVDYPYTEKTTVTFEWNNTNAEWVITTN